MVKSFFFFFNFPAKPGMFDFKGKAKWESWNGKKGTTKEEAMDLYVKKVQGLIESVGLAE